LDVSQALAIRELREAQAQKLIPARKSAIPGIASITAYAFLKLVSRRMDHHLRENGSANVHASLSGEPTHPFGSSPSPKNDLEISNRKIFQHGLSIYSAMACRQGALR
jgi:hypothetical protein